MVVIERYRPEQQAEWDAFIGQTRNATLLHRRGYMDYHSDRFADCSLLARDADSGHWIAVLPACADNNATLWSHRGLTYGGWLMHTKRATTPLMVDVVQAMTQWCRAEGFQHLVYKPAPYIYHRYPADDDIYALVAHGAVMTGCAISSTIDLSNPISFDRGNRSAVSAAQRNGIIACQSQQWEDFWQVLTDVLGQRHDTTPVHSLDEILLLHSRFPDEITLHCATLANQVLAGVVLYRTPTVAHTQYIAASELGRTMRALPAVMRHVADYATSHGCRFLDFGISTEDHGRVLNRGLAEQKTRFGGRGVAYNTYELRF